MFDRLGVTAAEDHERRRSAQRMRDDQRRAERHRLARQLRAAGRGGRRVASLLRRLGVRRPG